MSKLQTNKLQHTASGASEFTLPTSDGTTGQFMNCLLYTSDAADD